jgi:hypothetical protein
MADLERRLQALAAEAFPPAPDVRAAVAERIAAADAGARGGADPGARPAGRFLRVPWRARGRPAAEPAARPATEPAARPATEPAARRAAEPGVPPAAGARARAGRTFGAPSRGRLRVLAFALALVLVPSAAIAAVPGARHAVLDWLGLEHVRVERVPTVPPLPVLDRSELGTRVASVEAAARRAGLAVVVPRAPGVPDAVYVTADGLVSVGYEPRPGLPPDPQTGFGLLVTELRARGLPEYFAKTAGPRTLVEPVRVDGARGAFLSGEPHGLLIEQDDGRIRDLPSRLAGNTLVFERGGLVVRLEARFDRRAALALAASLRRVAP